MANNLVEFTVRCALQSFEDRKVQCPSEWTVFQLKKHLNEVCSSKPDANRMRLIYAGHCLENSKTLKEIFNKRHEGMEGADLGPQVIHMVCAPTQMAKAKETVESSLRRRQTAANNNPAAGDASFNLPAYSPNLGNPSTPLVGQNYSAFGAYGQPTDPSQQQAYYNYVAAYQNYMQTMMGYYQGGQPSFAPFMAFPQIGQAYQFPQNGFNFGAPQQNQFNFDQNAAAAVNQPAVNIQPQAAAAPVQNMNMDEQPHDLLDIIYKFIRFGLFLMILFLYSSMERFFMVCIVICVVWFLHMRRDRGQQIQQQQQQNQEVNNNNQRLLDEAVNDNNNNQVPTGEPSVPQEAPNAWTVFWSTVSSFFTSLIPENPVPMNVN